MEPGVRTGRSDSSGSSTWSKNSRASNCALCTTSSGVATGAMSRPRERAASSSSAFVLLRQNSPTMPFSRSYSSTGSRPS